VVALGDDVTKLKVGDRVGMSGLYSACGCCVNCQDGWEVVCGTKKTTAMAVPGCFSEYFLANAMFAHPIPDNVPFEQASPIMCAGITSYKGLKMSKVKPGQWVVIFGAAGGLGHVACQYAKAMGMRVIAITRKSTPEKLSMFQEYGVDVVVDSSAEDPTTAVKNATKGLGASGAICLAPNSKDVATAVGMVAARGTVVPIGIEGATFEIPAYTSLTKVVNIVPSVIGGRLDTSEALDFVARGKVKCQVSTRRLDELPQIYKEFENGTIRGRVVIKAD